MKKQRKVLITITYNEMGIIIDTKTEEVAQPKQDNTSNALKSLDCISRREALDAIDKYILGKKEDDNMEVRELMKLITKIYRMPSAQPEIVRCKDCRHGVDYYHEGDCYCSNPKWGLMYFGGSWEFYCADAERRQDERH